MKILLFSLSLFVFAYFTHLIIWRTGVPKKPLKALLVIFFAHLLLGVIGTIALTENNHSLSSSLNFNFFEAFHIVLLYVCLSLTYCLLYQGVSECSPSLVILLKLNNAKDYGLKIDDFYRLFDDDKLLTPRIRYLAENDLAYIEKDKYRLTPKGNIYVGLVKLQRKLFGFNKMSG